MLWDELDLYYFHSLDNDTMQIMLQSLHAETHRCSVRYALLVVGAMLSPH